MNFDSLRKYTEAPKKKLDQLRVHLALFLMPKYIRDLTVALLDSVCGGIDEKLKDGAKSITIKVKVE